MKVIIASDFHIRYKDNEEDIKRKKNVLEFLTSLIGNTDLLILNGDIFDLWYAWKNVIIKGYFSLYQVFYQLYQANCRIVFIAGNHDFWFTDFLSGDLKMEIYPECFSEKIDGLRFFVAHGDRFTTNDKRYQIFRSVIRNRLVMKIFAILHPDFSLQIGMQLSRSSRNTKIPKYISDLKEKGLYEAAKNKSDLFDLVVFGHSHKPREVHFEKGVYINSGDWIKSNSYVQILDGKPSLKYYKKKEN